MNDSAASTRGDGHFGWLPAGDGYFGWLPQQDGCFTAIPSFGNPVFRPNFVRVPAVVEVRLLFLRSNPPQLLIRATAEVPTAGWHTPILIPNFSPDAPTADGTYSFSMIACPPSGPDVTLPVVSKIQASTVLRPLPNDLQCVMVSGMTNSITKCLESDAEEANV